MGPTEQERREKVLRELHEEYNYVKTQDLKAYNQAIMYKTVEDAYGNRKAVPEDYQPLVDTTTDRHGLLEEIRDGIKETNELLRDLIDVLTP